MFSTSVFRTVSARTRGTGNRWDHENGAQARRDRDRGHSADAGRLYEFDIAYGNNVHRSCDALDDLASETSHDPNESAAARFAL